MILATDHDCSGAVTEVKSSVRMSLFEMMRYVVFHISFLTIRWFPYKVGATLTFWTYHATFITNWWLVTRIMTLLSCGGWADVFSSSVRSSLFEMMRYAVFHISFLTIRWFMYKVGATLTFWAYHATFITNWWLVTRIMMLLSSYGWGDVFNAEKFC